SITSAPFELIHCDLWTSPVLSISGFKYYLVIIDDFSHYALHTVTYLLNITPTTTLVMRTPHQVLFRQLPSYNHLRIFGCLCFPNLTTRPPTNLNPTPNPTSSLAMLCTTGVTTV
ncbi:hypothetical protein V2J09_004283, partial [Rumex salicifolius]